MSMILRLAVIITSLSLNLAQTNYALNQPTNQYTTIAPSAGCCSSNLAVDGNIETFSANTRDYLTPFRTWWTVKLSRWIRITSFRIYRRPYYDWGRRDIGYSYLVGPFWNLSLTGDVASGAISYDPFAADGFSLIYTQTASMYDMNDLLTVNVTTIATGRYFAVRTGNGGENTILCEVQVFGQPNQLNGTIPTLIVADPTPYVSSNFSKLTDEDETTCLTMLDQSASKNVVLQFATTPTGRFVVAVHSRGTLRALQRGGDQCNTGKFLGVSMPRHSNGINADYICQFRDQRADGVKSYFTFVCDCSECLSGMKIWLSQQISDNTDAAQLCEILLFNY